MKLNLTPRLGRVVVALGAAGLLAIGSFSSVYAADPTTATNSPAGNRRSMPSRAAKGCPAVAKVLRTWWSSTMWTFLS